MAGGWSASAGQPFLANSSSSTFRNAHASAPGGVFGVFGGDGGDGELMDQRPEPEQERYYIALERYYIALAAQQAVQAASSKIAFSQTQPQPQSNFFPQHQHQQQHQSPQQQQQSPQQQHQFPQQQQFPQPQLLQQQFSPSALSPATPPAAASGYLHASRASPMAAQYPILQAARSLQYAQHQQHGQHHTQPQPQIQVATALATRPNVPQQQQFDVKCQNRKQFQSGGGGGGDQEGEDCSAGEEDDSDGGWEVPTAPAVGVPIQMTDGTTRTVRRAKRGGKQGAAAAGSRLLLSKLEKAGYRADVVKALAAANNNPDAAVRLVPVVLVEAARGITRLEIERDGKFKATVDAAKRLAGNCWLKTWAQLSAQLPAAVKGLEALAEEADGVFMTSITAARAESKGCWITAWARLSKAKAVLEAVAKEEGGAALATEALDSSGMDMCKAAEALFKYKRQQQQGLKPGGGAALPAAAVAY